MIWTKAANGMRYHSKKRSPRLSTNSQVQSEAQHFSRISAQVRFAKAPLGTLQVFCHTKCTRPCSGSPPAPQDGDKDEVTAAGQLITLQGAFLTSCSPESQDQHCPLHRLISKGTRLGSLGLRAPGELLGIFLAYCYPFLINPEVTGKFRMAY